MPPSSEFSQEAMESSTLFGVAELNVDECFLSMDEGYLSMLGGEKTSYLGQHWKVSVHANDVGRAQEAYRMARVTGRGYAEIRALRNDSTIVYQSLTVTRVDDANGVFCGYQCLRHDISFYKRDQEILMQAVESAPNGLLMINSAGEIHWANRAVEQLFGYTREELTGCKVEMLLPETVRTRHLEYREQFHNDKNAKAMAGRDLAGRRKDGVEIPVQLYLNRVDTLEGEVILCTVIDIAERVRYQRQLELSQKAAEVANQAKSDFLSRMSHEIRTPMNLIMGMSALLLESPLNDNQRQHLEISYRNVRRLLRLINGILDLSKVEAGMLSLETAPFNLNEVLGECTATMSAAIEGKGLEFEMSVDPDVWCYVLGDAERLQQVLLNLIGNAVKFTAHGKITLSVHFISNSRGEQGVQFEVADTGCGIPPDKASLIFEPFQQVEGSLGRSYEGTGLGLSIAKTLVEMMWGKIWVDQTYTGGSKFVFTAFFPVTTEQEVRGRAKPSTSRQSEQGIAPGARVLLVEDNPENMILLRAYLENLGLSLDFAVNGEQAVQKRQQSTYDLVLMDIQMPVMDGLTATREIRAWEKAKGVPRIPVVALTAHAINGAAKQSIDAGCDDHLTKPVERHDLIATIVKFAKRTIQTVNQTVKATADGVSSAIAARRPAFLANRKQDVLKLRQALAAADFATIQSIGHNCKGTGQGYGFPEISTIGAAVEIAAKAQDPGEVEKTIREFELSLQAYA